MQIVSFDLSTTCIGTVAALVEHGQVAMLKSVPIYPVRFDPQTMGFHKYKTKLPNASGTLYTTYAKPGEKTITLAEKKRRDTLVREEKDRKVLADIGDSIHRVINAFDPDCVVVEKNEIFNGVLTSVLLGKVMGVLHGVCAVRHIPIYEYHVRDIRKPYDLMALQVEFVKGKTSEELKKIPDVTKRVIRDLMESKYDVVFQSDDESDACIALDYHLNHSGTFIPND